MRKLELVIELHEGQFWGRIWGYGHFDPVASGATKEELINNVKAMIEAYVQGKGKKDEFWCAIDLNKAVFDVRYDLQAFLGEFNFLKLSELAPKIKVSRTLLNQYKSGTKYPTVDQARRIQGEIKKLAQKIIETQSI